ncbi:MAG: hypothetical protein M1538_02070 [Candidatus Marsarchaeota archaeon]|jgi:hypothetical protein|nr:hypothetical protein [Candidatus Marsarchaeota archaeon]
MVQLIVSHKSKIVKCDYLGFIHRKRGNKLHAFGSLEMVIASFLFLSFFSVLVINYLLVQHSYFSNSYKINKIINISTVTQKAISLAEKLNFTANQFNNTLRMLMTNFTLLNITNLPANAVYTQNYTKNALFSRLVTINGNIYDLKVIR